MKLLIDANNTAYRAWKTTNLTTKQGENVSAIYGMIQMVQSYLKPSQGNYKNKMLDSIRMYQENEDIVFTDVVACWDNGKSAQRMKIFPEYKANRAVKRAERTPEEKAEYSQFIDQMEQLHHILPKFGVRSLKQKGWEGDDLLYVVSEFTHDVCVIVSTDKDMLQMVSDRIFVWSPTKEKLITPRNFTAVVGVPQESYLAYRILVGDSSDNINGVKGVGDKTAKALLDKYTDIKGLLANQMDIMGAKAAVPKRIFNDVSLLERNDDLMNLSKVTYDDIADLVESVLDERITFTDKEVKGFLASKQFVQIMSDFLMWSMPFRMLGDE